MPIFDQGYQHWQGTLSSHAWRWVAISRHGIAIQWKAKGVKAVFFMALFPALLLSGFLILWGLLEQKSVILTPFMPLFRGLPPQVLEGAKGYREVFWTLAFHAFFNVELFFSMLLVLLVGPNLVSQDLRFNAIPLYLSRPLTRLDYFIGKLGVIGFFVGLVSIVPPVLAYMIGAGFSMDVNVFHDTGRLLLASIAYGLVVVCSAGPLMLAFSSLSKNSRVVGAAWIGVWIISNVMGGVLRDTVRQDWCPIVSYQNDLLRIREALIDTPTARNKLYELTTSATQQVARPGLIGRALGKARRGNGPPSSTPLSFSTGRPVPPPRPGEDVQGNSTYPWQWSAGVLTGLCLLSIWTLSSRVKSLDRLK